MNLPLYTAILGAFMIVLQAALMLRVGLYRTKGVFIGVGDDPDLERLMRRHANLAENSGLFIAVLAILEILVGQTWYVATLCAVFAGARVMHAIGFSSLAGSHGYNLAGARKLFAGARMIGATGTALTAFGTATALILYLR